MAGPGLSFDPVQVPEVHTKYRTIKTAIPVPESLSIFEDLERYESNSMHGMPPVVWDRAEGFQIHDPWGNTWIDFTSTIFVANAGHGNPRIVKALTAQLQKPLLHTYTYVSTIRRDYLRYLIESTPEQFEKAFLLSAGTESTECALKLMRMHGWDTGKQRPGIIAFEGNWHGRTMGAQMMSHAPQQKEWIGHQDPNMYHLPFPYPWRPEAMQDPVGYFRAHLNSLLEEHDLDPSRDFCGVMLETFQGWGAVFYPKEFVQAVVEFAHENGMLVAFDEMQSGFGRTGALFGYMQYDVEPDLLCLGKGAGSGVPLSAVLGSREVMDRPGVGAMSSTHSANPLVCAAGLANLQALQEDGLIENSRILGEHFHDRLLQIKARYPDVLQFVLGKGLLAAIHFRDRDGNPLGDLATAVCEEAIRRGLLPVYTGRESIKLAPPLCIHEEPLMDGLDVLDESIAAALDRN